MAEADKDRYDGEMEAADIAAAEAFQKRLEAREAGPEHRMRDRAKVEVKIKVYISLYQI